MTARKNNCPSRLTWLKSKNAFAVCNAQVTFHSKDKNKNCHLQRSDKYPLYFTDADTYSQKIINTYTK